MQKREIIFVNLPFTSHFMHFQSVRQKKWNIHNKTNEYRWHFRSKAKEKYRGVFEIQRSGDKTSSGEIGLDIRTHASPKVGQDQGVRRSKRPLLACRTRCICSMETLQN